MLSKYLNVNVVIDICLSIIYSIISVKLRFNGLSEPTNFRNNSQNLSDNANLYQYDGQNKFKLSRFF